MTESVHFHTHHAVLRNDGQFGFGLAEFLVSALVLLVIASSVFGLLSEIQRKTSYQAEVQSVLNNTRLAMLTIGRHLRQAGNDPLGLGFAGIRLAEPSQVGICSDLTGSAGPGNPDKGDPDGDILDSGEDVIIRYNRTTRSLEIVPGGSSAQVVAGNISDLAFQYYDAEGRPTAALNDIRKIKVIVSGASLLQDPETHRSFAVQLSSDFQVAI